MAYTHKLLIVVAAGALFAAGAASAAPISKAQADKIIAAVQAVEAQWNEDIKTRDPAKFASHYTEDGTLISPGDPVANGRAAIEAAMKEAFSDANFTLAFKAEDIGVSPDGRLAYTQGACLVADTSPTTHAKEQIACRYVTVYRLEGGIWKAVEDISTPTPAVAAAIAGLER
jgi:uncharacterized protein (TIGR02246 family)